MATINLLVNGRVIAAESGSSVAAAMLSSGITTFRTSVSGEPRAPLCGMGICFECRVTIEGQDHARSCQITVQDGMVITT
ncbi:MAG: ferredoxin [Bryobacterales bacterium]|jgi:predicted molibdopterin-dependent oxidoreductase YjgC|nr:ferredoxin [Bryobacterales bacterium]